MLWQDIYTQDRYEVRLAKCKKINNQSFTNMIQIDRNYGKQNKTAMAFKSETLQPQHIFVTVLRKVYFLIYTNHFTYIKADM